MASPKPSIEPRHYRLFGLAIRSEVVLPELHEVPTERHDVSIVRASVEEPEPPLTIGLARAAGGAIIRVPDIGRLRVSGGNRIEVDLLEGQAERNIRLFILGSAMGALLHQRELLPVHANAIEIGDRAIAFAGRSKAGKSTLAAAFHDRHFPLLSDDICVVTDRPDGGIDAQPGIPRGRLWRDAVERSGRRAENLTPAFDGVDKYVLPLDQRHARNALPLAALFILANGEDGSAPLLTPLNMLDATRALVSNTYRGAYVPLVGNPQAHFDACVRLTRKVPVFALHRPWDASRIDETIDRVLERLQTLG